MAADLSCYLHALSAPLFRTLGEVEPLLDTLLCGRNAAVFKLRTPNGTKALKCFLTPPAAPREIYAYLAEVNSPLLATRTEFLPRELWLFDEQRWADVAISDWVAGTTLETLIARGDAAELRKLAESFDDLARQLLQQEWAHGDLKPENILVDEALRMTLIDYDAMFIPALAGRAAQELGTPPWQHPARDARLNGKHLDDYPIAMIATSLHALARWPELRQTGDHLLLDPAEVVGGRSPIYKVLLERCERAGEARLHALAGLLTSPTPQLEVLPQILHAGLSPIGEPLEMFIERGKWGYRTAAGQVAIHAQYERAFDFSQGLAAVRLGGSWHFIDAQNRIRINGAAWTQVKPFHEGLAAVQQDGKWGYIRTDGRWAIGPRYDAAWNFQGGQARVIEGDRELWVGR